SSKRRSLSRWLLRRVAFPFFLVLDARTLSPGIHVSIWESQRPATSCVAGFAAGRRERRPTRQTKFCTRLQEGNYITTKSMPLVRQAPRGGGKVARFPPCRAGPEVPKIRLTTSSGGVQVDTSFWAGRPLNRGVPGHDGAADCRPLHPDGKA